MPAALELGALASAALRIASRVRGWRSSSGVVTSLHLPRIFTNRQTRREPAAQSHGTLEVRRATERKQPRRVPSTTYSLPRPQFAYSQGILSVRPGDMPGGHASGPAPHRFLLVGAEAAAGFGVASHELSLAGCLARGISGRTGHGSDVDLVVSDNPALGYLEALLRRQPLGRLDGLVLVLSPDPSWRGLTTYSADLRTLLTSLVDRLPDAVQVTVVAAPPLIAPAADAVRETDRFSSFARMVESAGGSPARFVGLAATPSDSRPMVDLYQRWAEEISDALCRDLREPWLWLGPVQRVDETARQQAVNQMGLLDEVWETQFEQIVATARAAYGVRYASLSVIDGTRTRFLAQKGNGIESLPREDTAARRFRAPAASSSAMPDSILASDTSHPSKTAMPCSTPDTRSRARTDNPSQSCASSTPSRGPSSPRTSHRSAISRSRRNAGSGASTRPDPREPAQQPARL